MEAKREIIIGVPVHNDLQSFKSMYKSLCESTWTDFTLLIIESESTDGCAEYCDYLSKDETENDFRSIEVIHTKKEGPLKAYNKLFEIAKERNCDLLLTQTDVIFPKLYIRDWLDEMNNIACNEHLGAIIPYNGGKHSGVDYIKGFFWLGGWCTYLPYRTLERIGGYDESFPNGYGVDIDYTKKLEQSGLDIAYIDYYVDHHMCNERQHDKDVNTEQMKKESALYFRKKWKVGEF
jgi:GT2 family glycosyltransferase